MKLTDEERKIHHKEACRKWSAKHIVEIRTYHREYHRAHKDRCNENSRKLYHEHRDTIIEKDRLLRKTDPVFRAKEKRLRDSWKTKNPEKYSCIMREAGKRSYAKHRAVRLKEMHDYLLNHRLEVIYWYSGGSMQCATCGELHIEFLAVDHINDNGNRDRKIIKGNYISYLIRENFPDGYQILCHNCNAIKQSNRTIRKNPNAPYNRHIDKIKKEMRLRYSRRDGGCSCCGITDGRCLSFHHINGGGTKHMKEIRMQLVKYLHMNLPPVEEFDVLCCNCNKSHGHYGYCPHDVK